MVNCRVFLHHPPRPRPCSRASSRQPLDELDRIPRRRCRSRYPGPVQGVESLLNERLAHLPQPAPELGAPCFLRRQPRLELRVRQPAQEPKNRGFVLGLVVWRAAVVRPRGDALLLPEHHLAHEGPGRGESGGQGWVVEEVLEEHLCQRALVAEQARGGNEPWG